MEPRAWQELCEPAANSATAGSAGEPDADPVSDEPLLDEQEMPLPSDLRTVFLGGIFLLAFFATLYGAREIVLPIVLALVLNLLLQPVLRMLERLHVPRMLGALLLIGLVLATIVAFGTALSGPAASWAAKLPEGVPRLQEQSSVRRSPRAHDVVPLGLIPVAWTGSGEGKSVARRCRIPLRSVAGNRLDMEPVSFRRLAPLVQVP